MLAQNSNLWESRCRPLMLTHEHKLADVEQHSAQVVESILVGIRRELGSLLILTCFQLSPILAGACPISRVLRED